MHADGTFVVQMLEPKTVTVAAATTPLVQGGVDFGQDPPLSARQSIAFRGRGVGGDWEVGLPQAQPDGEPIDLSGLTTVAIRGYRKSERVYPKAGPYKGTVALALL